MSDTTMDTSVLQSLVDTIQRLEAQINTLSVNTSNELHSIPIQETYGWTPDEILITDLGMSSDLFTTLMDTEEHKKLIDSYPPIQNMVYTPLATLPLAQSHFKPHQTREDMALCKLQYSLSAAFGTLKILAHEILIFAPEDQAVKYLGIIKDVRKLIVHSNATINQSWNSLAVQTINPKFQTTGQSSRRYTMDSQIFQQTLLEQFSNQEAMHKVLQLFRGNRPSGSKATHQGNSC
ncbi:hypothetical protein CLU79DRAFT_728825 [Phycomyces nitens]|nr:hypothetical protein CLU79DRAFT_728825 [Phycomyces nitens]